MAASITLFHFPLHFCRSPIFEFCHIFKVSVTYIYVMILSCIMVTRQLYILNIICVYFYETNLLTSANSGFCVFLYDIHIISQ
jgi:hypothetical protein